MPVPKGVNKEKYDRCVDKVKSKGKGVNSYAVCASSLKGKSRKGSNDMKKSKVIEVIMKSLNSEKEYSSEELQEIVSKALTSQSITESKSVENSDELKPPSIQDSVSTVESDKKQQVEPEKSDISVAKNDVESTNDSKPKEEANSEPKFAKGLFGQPTILGSTLQQTASGNVMRNVKKPAMDYEQTYKQSTKNESFSAEQLQELRGKK